MKITKGWRFYTADFSLQASGKEAKGTVTLVRSPDQREVWHNLSEEEQEKVALYVSAEGTTVSFAMAAASISAKEIGAITIFNGE